MSILSTIKSLLGVGRGDRESADPGTPVSVEREPAVESERAVEDVDDAPSTEDAGATDGVEGTPAAGAVGEAADADGEPVDSLKGIGAAYAERLADAGVHTVEDLAAADPETLDAETDLGAGRLENWVEQARARTR